jgi:hypothetical protein
VTTQGGAFDTLQLDRELARAARHWQTWRRRLRAGEGFDEDPFEPSRAALGRATFDAVSELQDADPLKRPLARWVYRLAEQRINRAALVAVEVARRAPRVVDAPEHTRLSLQDMLQHALREAQRRSGWLASYVDHAEPLSNATALLWQRRREVAERLNVADEWEQPAAQLTTAAEAWLKTTRDAAHELLPGRSLAALVEGALGREASDGWPARITPRSLQELLAPTGFLDRVALDPGRLPEAVAASSVMRALARVGAAWIDALAPDGQPFVIAHDAYGLERRRAGALFAGLALSPLFLKKQLGLGRARAAAHRRALGRIVLIESRAAALRVLLRRPALAGARAFGEAFETLTERAFGFGVAPVAAGTLFRLHGDDGQRFAGLLAAAAQSRRLVEEHDEDWFFNPRAADQLRSEAMRPPAVEMSADDVARVTADAWTAIAEVLE